MAKDACTNAVREPWRRDEKKSHKPCGPDAAGLEAGRVRLRSAGCMYRVMASSKLHEKARTEIEQGSVIIAVVTCGDEAATQPYSIPRGYYVFARAWAVITLRAGFGLSMHRLGIEFYLQVPDVLTREEQEVSERAAAIRPILPYMCLVHNNTWHDIGALQVLGYASSTTADANSIKIDGSVSELEQETAKPDLLTHAAPSYTVPVIASASASAPVGITPRTGTRLRRAGPWKRRRQCRHFCCASLCFLVSNDRTCESTSGRCRLLARVQLDSY
ncbi:uncharacterized protein TrAtP1_012065 [Trichoderma atroviride]|uniref:uncharacterized protein n=1 Tax=Hypocrea atroviridis TaxID=63577 RepID=UPI003323F427|nr:hypothetical protein TrAtP1_012065 [Trichoderma atroviride]